MSPAVEDAPSEALIDTQVLMGLEDMSSEPGQDLLGEVIEILFQTAPGTIASLQDLLNSGDMPALARAAHGFKSSSSAIGATRMFARTLGLEKAAKSGDVMAARAAMAGLVAVWEPTRRALEDFLGGRT